MNLRLFLSSDVATADQQKTAGPQQDQEEDQNDGDVAMETEDQEEDLQAAEVQELKPEQLDSTKASQKGVNTSAPADLFQNITVIKQTGFGMLQIVFQNTPRIPSFGFAKLACALTSPPPLLMQVWTVERWRCRGRERRRSRRDGRTVTVTERKSKQREAENPQFTLFLSCCWTPCR